MQSEAQKGFKAIGVPHYRARKMVIPANAAPIEQEVSRTFGWIFYEGIPSLAYVEAPPSSILQVN